VHRHDQVHGRAALEPLCRKTSEPAVSAVRTPRIKPPHKTRSTTEDDKVAWTPLAGGPGPGGGGSRGARGAAAGSARRRPVAASRPRRRRCAAPRLRFAPLVTPLSTPSRQLMPLYEQIRRPLFLKRQPEIRPPAPDGSSHAGKRRMRYPVVGRRRASLSTSVVTLSLSTIFASISILADAHRARWRGRSGSCTWGRARLSTIKYTR
jgi:hypothetical protein